MLDVTLTLTLLVLGILTDDKNATVTTHGLTITTNRFYGSAYFHV